MFCLPFPLYEYFRSVHEYFLGLLGVHDFFKLNFLLREYFFVLHPPLIGFLMVRKLRLQGLTNRDDIESLLAFLDD